MSGGGGGGSSGAGDDGSSGGGSGSHPPDHLSFDIIIIPNSCASARLFSFLSITFLDRHVAGPGRDFSTPHRRSLMDDPTFALDYFPL